MNFTQQLQLAKTADTGAMTALVELYKPLLLNRSYLDGRFDEDLHQTQLLVLIRCVKHFALPHKNSAQTLDRREDKVYNVFRN